MSGRITYLGHATVLVELAGARLLTDPLLRGRVARIIRRHGPDPPVPARLDAVLLSHLHRDHLDLPSLRAIGAETRLVAPAGSGALLARKGFHRVEELVPGGALDVGEVRVTATVAAHDGRRQPIGTKIPALGFELAGAGRRVYFAGDTDLFAGMGRFADRLDVALLPISGWGPKLSRGHLDPRRAAEAAALLRPRVVVPIHWGTFLRADLHRRRPELLEDPPREFEAQLAALAPGVEARILEPGGSLELGEDPAAA